eukprot:TCONS_00071669-protein
MRYLIIIGQILVQFGLLFGVFDNDDKIKPQIYGSITDKFTATWSINKARELTNELIAERSDGTKFVEGDLRVTPLLAQIRTGQQVDPAEIANKLKWKSNVIPYVFHETITEHKRGAIEAAIKDFHQFTVIRFAPRTNEPDYLNFIKDNGCWSFVGCQGGPQDISIGNGCGYRGTVIHQIMHALGFLHENTRTDRENYLTIDSNNIEEGFAHDFEKYENRMIYMNGVPANGDLTQSQNPGIQNAQLLKFNEYDYFSITHLGCHAFSTTSELKTMQAKDDEVDDNDLGQRNGFSHSDIERLKAAYGELAKLNNANDNVNDITVSTNGINLKPTEPLTKPLDNLNPNPLRKPDPLATEPLSKPLDNLNPNPLRKPDPLAIEPLTKPLDNLNPNQLMKPDPIATDPLNQHINNLPDNVNHPLLKPSNTGTLEGNLQRLHDPDDPLPNPSFQDTTNAHLNLQHPLTKAANANNLQQQPSHTLPHLNNPELQPTNPLNPTQPMSRPLIDEQPLDLMRPHDSSIPGNPGPGLHNNVGGMAGVDGIGPNGLPVGPGFNPLEKPSLPLPAYMPTPHLPQALGSELNSLNSPDARLSQERLSQDRLSQDRLSAPLNAFNRLGSQGLPAQLITTPLPPTALTPTVLQHVVMRGEYIPCSKCPPKRGDLCTCPSKPRDVKTSQLLSKLVPGRHNSVQLQSSADLITCNSYPCWPDDFVWSDDGLPPNCNCGPKSKNPNTNPVCRCNCIKMHSDKSDSSWNNNLLCFRDTKLNPRLILSTNPHLPQRKCLRFPQSNVGWKDTFLCMDSNVPYHLFWSRNNDDMADKNQCLLISEPDDKQWNKMYLCNAL